MHPITLLAVFVMVLFVQALIWTPALLASDTSDGFFLEKYFQFFYALGTHDVAWGDIFNLDSKTLKVFTNKEFYNPGETIIVKGSVKPFKEGKTVTLAISDEHEKIIFLDYAAVDSKGVFAEEIPIEKLHITDSNKFTVSVHVGLDQSFSNFIIGEKEISFDKIMEEILKENSDTISEKFLNSKETQINSLKN